MLSLQLLLGSIAYQAVGEPVAMSERQVPTYAIALLVAGLVLAIPLGANLPRARLTEESWHSAWAQIFAGEQSPSRESLMPTDETSVVPRHMLRKLPAPNCMMPRYLTDCDAI